MKRHGRSHPNGQGWPLGVPPRIGRRDVVKTTGDGVLALLPSASAALTVAERVRRELAAEDLDIRVGIHVGDIDKRGDDISGPGGEPRGAGDVESRQPRDLRDRLRGRGNRRPGPRVRTAGEPRAQGRPRRVGARRPTANEREPGRSLPVQGAPRVGSQLPKETEATVPGARLHALRCRPRTTRRSPSACRLP